MSSVEHICGTNGHTLLENAFADDVIAGLSMMPKSIPSKYFYDATGSRLFQQIMELPEYYLTRCELEILRTHGRRIAALISRRPFRLIELGVGDGLKTDVLLRRSLEASADFEFVPIDICAETVRGVTTSFRRLLPELGPRIQGIVAEYLDGLARLDHNDSRRNVVMLLGSNIGNFAPDDARRFLEAVRDALNPGDYLLIGFDLKKSISLLWRAYNDSQGVTREFNFNLLDRINRELAGNFIRSQFLHYAPYNPRVGCMESWLVSRVEQSVRLDAVDREFHFDAWEGIAVERSHKYTLGEIEALAATAGYLVDEHFLDRHRYFADSLWRVEPSAH
jgi:L-histidine N-alpha-methyltransferase